MHTLINHQKFHFKVTFFKHNGNDPESLKRDRSNHWWSESAELLTRTRSNFDLEDGGNHTMSSEASNVNLDANFWKYFNVL